VIRVTRRQKSEKKAAKKPAPPTYVNRKAFRDYHILERFEAGIALAGQEVKSIRAGGASLRDAYAQVKDGDVILFDLHIATYKFATIDPLPPRRPRRLLLNKREIRKIKAKIDERGMTIIPLKLYFVRHLVKVELGVCKGKRYYEKRETIAKKDAERERDREMRERE